MRNKGTFTCDLLELLFHSLKHTLERPDQFYFAVILWYGCLRIVCRGDDDCDYMFDAGLESLSLLSSNHHQSFSCQTIINCPNLCAAALLASDWWTQGCGGFWLVRCVTAGPPGRRLGDLKAIRARALRWAMACKGTKKLITATHNLYKHIRHVGRISHFWELGKCNLNFHLYLSVGANKMVLVFYSAFSHPGPNSFIWLRPLMLAPLSHVESGPSHWRIERYLHHTSKISHFHFFIFAWFANTYPEPSAL